jgi:ankyrin repeat protein
MNPSDPRRVIKALYTNVRKTIEKYLDQNNVNAVDAEGYSLLNWVITGMVPGLDLNTHIVRLLIQRGADVNIRLREGGTLLHFVVHLLQKDLALELLRAGCDPNAMDDVGHTPLTRALWAFDPKADMIELLLEHGADPHLKLKGGESVLEIAARTGQLHLFPPKYREQAKRSGE